MDSNKKMKLLKTKQYEVFISHPGIIGTDFHNHCL